MTIKINLDAKSFDHKPTGAEPGAIRNRLCNADAITELTPEELADAIQQGQTFTPGVMTGTKGSTWQSQQIICADIDNGEKKGSDFIPCKAPITPDTAQMLMSFYNITPNFMYYSFSHAHALETYKVHKFRIVLVLDEVITDPTEAKDITKRFAQIFNKYSEGCADDATHDTARIFYGSVPGSVFDQTGAITSLETLRALPPVEDAQAQSEPNTEHKTAPATRNTYNDRFDLIPLLDFIDPDEYETWYRVGMALYNEGYDCSDWDAWSMKSAKYKPGECFEKWQSFAGSSIEGGYITNLAKANGYIPPKDRIQSAQPAPAVRSEAVPPPTDEDAPPEHVPHFMEPEPAQIPPTPEPIPWRSGVDMLNDFLCDIETFKYKPIKTGIDALDKALFGGLISKTLVTLGAAPGMGKTAIAQYILENIARNGRDVLYINLEMDRTQLIARSIARTMHTNKITPDMSTLDIMRGYRWNENERKAIKKAADIYRDQIAPHFIYNPEGITSNLSSIINACIEDIKQKAKEGKPAPIICVDYLQLINYDMQPEGTRAPDAIEGLKLTITELKRIALDFDTCVFVIIAHNRASNKEGTASMESGRDTSTIEYTGDLMLGLSYTAIADHEIYDKEDPNTGKVTKRIKDLDYIRDRISEADKNGLPRPDDASRLCLQILKSRFTDSGRKARFIFDGEHCSFTEED